MKMNNRIRQYIKNNGWSYTFVANRAEYPLNKLSRQLNNKQSITTDEYEQICKGLMVDPSFLFHENFLETQNETA